MKLAIKLASIMKGLCQQQMNIDDPEVLEKFVLSSKYAESEDLFFSLNKLELNQIFIFEQRSAGTDRL